MLKFIKVGFILTLFGSAFASDYAVGVINVQEIMKTSSRIKNESSQLKERFSSQAKNIEQMRKSLASDVNKLRKNKTVMSKKDKTKLEKKIAGDQKTLQQTQMDFSKKIMAAQQKVIMKVKNDFETMAQDFAKRNNLSLVLDQNGQVLYVVPKYDLTSQAKKKFK